MHETQKQIECALGRRVVNLDQLQLEATDKM